MSSAKTSFKWPLTELLNLFSLIQSYSMLMEFQANVTHQIPPQGTSTIDVVIEFTTCDNGAKNTADMFTTIVSRQFPQRVIPHVSP